MFASRKNYVTPSSVICATILLLLCSTTFALGKKSQNSASLTITAVGNSPHTELEPINGTLNFRIYGKKGNDDKPWLSGRVIDLHQHIQCVRRGSCSKVTFNSCLGAKIPYEYTSLDLTDFGTQEEMLERLNKSRALQHVPKCWAVIQPFLCAVFAPKCEQINGQDMVYLPSLEMCRITLEPCRILYNTSYFPEFLRCNETLFPSKCSNDVREMKFNVTGSCLQPLVPADSSVSYYPGIEGCGVRCKDPLYTDDEHRQIHKLIGWCGTLCLLSNLFVVATFYIDWKNANKYPAVLVFYINLCFLLASFGWLAQFTPGSRDDIVCRKDGTLRHSEPTAGENLSCVVVFVVVYYFLMAAMVWFVFLTYSWHFRAVGNVQDRINKKGSYFHLVAWSLPLVLTIITMALSEVDGNSTAGICFVGYLNHSFRAGLLLGPLCAVVIVGGFFIIRGMVMLCELKHFARNIKSTASNKLHMVIVRMGLCAIFTLIFVLVAIACHITEFRDSPAWAESLREYIICRISSTFLGEHEHVVCKIENRPSVAIMQLHLLCLFGAGIAMSSWCWTPASVETWKRYYRKKCNKEKVEEIRMSKHKVIAQTWAKRKEFEDKGRLSITLYNTHTDPVGLNFDVNDLNSSETNEISSTWANYLPQFVKRRMAITGAGTANSSSQGPPRKNSLDSEISFSVRHVSVESRRNSVDSQVSVKIAEMKTKVASRSRSGHHHHHHSSKHATAASNKRSQRRRDFYASSATGRKYSNGRRESSTSIESQTFALNKITYPNASHKVGLFAQSTRKHSSGGGGVVKNMKRRSANAGLAPADLNFILPFLQNQGMTTSSDEETSRASFKIHDSRLDVVYKHDLSDDNDQDYDVPNEHHRHNADGQRIEEILDTTSHERNGRNAKKQAAIENLLKHMQKSNESSTQQRNSRNSLRSRQSRKAQTVAAALAAASNSNAASSNNRHSQRKNIEHKVTAAEFLNGNDSVTSYCSELDSALELMRLQQSSCSDGDLSTGKPNSRNSKTSCDVGIQANAYDITQTTFGEDEQRKQKTLHQLNAKNRRNSDYGDYGEADATEKHALLNGGGGGSNKHQIYNFNHHQFPHKETLIMSESEKLKILLLPNRNN